MKHIVLDSHEYTCTSHKDNPRREKLINSPYSTFVDICALNPNVVVFYVLGQFVLIEYHLCLEHGDKYELYKEWISTIINQEAKKTEKWSIYSDTSRGYSFDKYLRKKSDLMTEKNIGVNQIHYMYLDAAHKQYCLCTTLRFDKMIIDNVSIDEKADKAIEYLEKNDLHYLIDEVNQLRMANYIHASEKTIVNTIDKISKLLKTEL